MVDRKADPKTPTDGHGMGVFGIIAAQTNNKIDIAGIAPGTRQIVMKRPDFLSDRYVSALRWAAGLEVSSPDPGWPPNPIVNKASVICCSHGYSMGMPGYLKNTLRDIATAGRDGLGTLVIYSVGDAGIGGFGTEFSGHRAWAAHDGTMAVANSLPADPDNPERKTDESNYGPELDICAQGEGSTTLTLGNATSGFSKTSAAAAHVAGMAALVFSVDPDFTATEVRNFLTSTAVKIDPQNASGPGQWETKLGSDHSDWYGYGRVDVGAAVAEAITTVAVVKKSGSGICHAPSSPWYNATTNFIAYSSVADCLESDGRLPND